MDGQRTGTDRQGRTMMLKDVESWLLVGEMKLDFAAKIKFCYDKKCEKCKNLKAGNGLSTGIGYRSPAPGTDFF